MNQPRPLFVKCSKFCKNEVPKVLNRFKQKDFVELHELKDLLLFLEAGGLPFSRGRWASLHTGSKRRASFSTNHDLLKSLSAWLAQHLTQNPTIHNMISWSLSLKQHRLCSSSLNSQSERLSVGRLFWDRCQKLQKANPQRHPTSSKFLLFSFNLLVLFS